MAQKRYYREWLASCGWGVMMAYDTIMAVNKRSARERKPISMYAYDKSFELIKKVKRKHLDLSDEDLSKIYGEKDKK